jgi:CheY-like chemotaxis protein
MSLALVIEDEPELAGFVAGAFHYLGFEAPIVESTADALELIERAGNVEVVFVHLSREGEQRIFISTIARRWPAIKIILLSSHAENIGELPSSILLTKPTNPATLMAIIMQAALGGDLSPRGLLH